MHILLLGMSSDQAFSLRRIVLETEPQMIASRVTMRGAEGEVPLSEQVGQGGGHRTLIIFSTIGSAD